MDRSVLGNRSYWWWPIGTISLIEFSKLQNQADRWAGQAGGRAGADKSRKMCSSKREKPLKRMCSSWDRIHNTSFYYRWGQ